MKVTNSLAQVYILAMQHFESIGIPLSAVTQFGHDTRVDHQLIDFLVTGHQRHKVSVRSPQLHSTVGVVICENFRVLFHGREIVLADLKTRVRYYLACQRIHNASVDCCHVHNLLVLGAGLVAVAVNIGKVLLFLILENFF